MKTWKVSAQLNHDASDIREIFVKANTQRKAEMYAKTQFQRMAKFIDIKNCVEV